VPRDIQTEPSRAKELVVETSGILDGDIDPTPWEKNPPHLLEGLPWVGQMFQNETHPDHMEEMVRICRSKKIPRINPYPFCSCPL